MKARWALAAAGLALVAMGAADAVQCDPVRGPFDATLEAGPPCDSHIDLNQPVCGTNAGTAFRDDVGRCEATGDAVLLVCQASD